MSEHVSAATQEGAVPTEAPYPPQHGVTNHAPHQHGAINHTPHQHGAINHDHHQHAHPIPSQPRENDPEQGPQTHEHQHAPPTHQNHVSSHEHSEMVMGIFHDQMMTLAYKNTPESNKEASDIADMLLERAELPLAIRVRAHIVLACGKTAYLHHAQEAVRFAEKGREIYGPGETSESRAAVEGLLWEARETLRRAERDMEELKDIRKRIKAGTLKGKKGEKLPYGNINDDHDKAADKPSAGESIGDDHVGSAAPIQDESSDGDQEGEVATEEASTSEEASASEKAKTNAEEELATSDKSSDEASDKSEAKKSAVEGSEEDEEQDILGGLPADLVRQSLGRKKHEMAGSGIMTPEVTPHATPRRSKRFKSFNKDYVTGKAKER